MRHIERQKRHLWTGGLSCRSVRTYLHAEQCAEFYVEEADPDMTSSTYFRRLRKALPSSSSRMRLRWANGSIIPHESPIYWADAYLKVDKLEAYVRSNPPVEKI
jgi:hypothetical protein